MSKRRCDIDDAELVDGVAMVEREPVRDAPAAIVAAHEEALVAERAHQRQHVVGHRALAVVGVVRLAARLRGVTIAAQVGHHEVVALAQAQCDAMPDRMRLRKAVQQQQRRTGLVAAGAREQRDVAELVVPCVEAVEPAHRALRSGMRRNDSACVALAWAGVALAILAASADLLRLRALKKCR